MKKLLIAFLLLLSFKSNSQLIIAPAGNAAPAGNYPAIFDIHLKGGYRAVKDTFERNAIPLSYRNNMMLVGDTTSRKVWIFDSLRNSWSELGSGSSIDPSANQTITAPLWDFKNYVHIGENHSSGLWNNDLLTVVGNWSNDGTNLTVDADNGLVQSWGNFQVWGFVGENDYATVNAQINSDGSASFASNISNPNVTIYQNGQIDIAEAIDLYPDGRAEFATGACVLQSDGGGHLASWNIYWDASGNLSNEHNGAWSIGHEGNASFRSIHNYYTDDYNYYRELHLSSDNVTGLVNDNDGTIRTWQVGTGGLSSSKTYDGGDTYTNWDITSDGVASLYGLQIKDASSNVNAQINSDGSFFSYLGNQTSTNFSNFKIDAPSDYSGRLLYQITSDLYNSDTKLKINPEEGIQLKQSDLENTLSSTLNLGNSSIFAQVTTADNYSSLNITPYAFNVDAILSLQTTNARAGITTPNSYTTIIGATSGDGNQLNINDATQTITANANNGYTFNGGNAVFESNVNAIAFNGSNITLTGGISFDDGAITSDGSGNLSLHSLTEDNGLNLGVGLVTGYYSGASKWYVNNTDGSAGFSGSQVLGEDDNYYTNYGFRVSSSGKISGGNTADDYWYIDTDGSAQFANGGVTISDNGNLAANSIKSLGGDIYLFNEPDGIFDNIYATDEGFFFRRNAGNTTILLNSTNIPNGNQVSLQLPSTDGRIATSVNGVSAGTNGNINLTPSYTPFTGTLAAAISGGKSVVNGIIVQ